MKVKKAEPSRIPLKRSLVFMYEQQVEYMPTSIDKLLVRIKRLGNLDKWAYILHDKDVKQSQVPIPPHYHVVLIFKKRVSLDAVAKRLGDKPQQFEVMTKRGQGARQSSNNALAYLTHRTTNAQNKYQYSPADVKANFDYEAFLKSQEEQILPQDILDKLAVGDIDKKRAIQMLIAEGGGVLAKYKRKIDDIASARMEIEFDNWRLKMKKRNVPIKIIWCYGVSGTGKTRYAKNFCEERRLNYYICSGSNAPFDGLINLSADEQKVIIVDELRPNVIKYADLLQILDPMNFEKVAVARYHNPHVMAEVIFICTVYSPLSFYKALPVMDAKIDDFNQLIRRLGLIIKFTPESIFEMKYKIVNGNIECAKVNEKVNPFRNSGVTSHFSINELESYETENDSY